MSDPNTFRIRNYYEQLVPIDDGVEGEAKLLPVRIRRFSVAQMLEFQRGFNRAMDPPSKRAIFRKPDGDEQEKRTYTVVAKKTAGDGTVTETSREESEYRIPDSEIERRRLEEMTPDQMAAHELAIRVDEEFAATFAAKVITDHVWLPPHVTLEVEQEDGQTVRAKTGADLVNIFGGNIAMFYRLLSVISEENALSAELKKVLRLRSASTRSSLASIETADGGAPAAIATAVEPSDSAESAPAMALSGSILSGSTTH